MTATRHELHYSLEILLKHAVNNLTRISLAYALDVQVRAWQAGALKGEAAVRDIAVSAKRLREIDT